ncbi:hypothetical protein IWQ61_004221 [Dispira simplex]|nr:hypothetical protein IWQ61_004221 [Dispira simplex]
MDPENKDDTVLDFDPKYYPITWDHHRRRRRCKGLWGLLFLTALLVVVLLGVAVYSIFGLEATLNQVQARLGIVELYQGQRLTTLQSPPPKEPSENQTPFARETHNREVFGQIYVVNLAKRTDRKDSMITLLRFLDLPGLFTSAVTPDDLAFVPKSAEEHGVGKDQLACWRSHMNIYQDVVRRNLPRALILEDDIDLELNVTDIVETKLQHIPLDWDIFYLGHCSVGKYYGEMWDKEHGIRLLNGGWCTHAYMVTQRGAQRLLNLLAKPTAALDQMLAELGEKQTLLPYAAEPQVVAQLRREDDPSDISSSGHSKLWERLVNPARQALNKTLFVDPGDTTLD